MQGLTPVQAGLAHALWHRAAQVRGPVTGFRRALRIGGIIFAVKPASSAIRRNWDRIN